jgi:cardiolipin synthase C
MYLRWFVFTFVLCQAVAPGEFSARCYTAALGSVADDTSVARAALGFSAAELEDATALYLLENGGKSLAARLWLIDHARRSIRMQYFSFSRNVTGLIACEHLVRAADRGVKVELLVDEAAGRMNGYEIKILDAHQNIEIRVYNAGLKLGRPDRQIRKLVQNSNRLLRRMHNKTLIIDGVAAITGGRNVSDEYFDYGRDYNFRDRDLLMIGRQVIPAQQSFVQFWESELTSTLEELEGKSKYPFDVRELFEKANKIKNDTAEFGPAIRAHIFTFQQEFLKAKGDNQIPVLRTVQFISDIPGKNENRPQRKGGTTVDSIIALIRNAEKTLDIQSPYFITTGEARNLLKEAVGRGVKVRILTNSLAAIDNVEAFSAYRKDRRKNLEAGLEIYEFRPDPQVRFHLSIPDVQARDHYKAVYGLHSKSMIVDGKTSVVGSYNLDPRSANYNTECITVVRSPKFAKTLEAYVAPEFQPANSWHVTAGFNPDKEASMKKRFMALIKTVFPKKLL